MKAIDLTGKTFGRLTVIGRVAFKGRTHWECLCSCGKMTTVYCNSLTRGATRSCGCMEIEARQTNHLIHGGMAGGPSKTFNSWRAMMARCYDSKSEKFPSYGGRGITVCERWKEFSNFLADMGERPKDLTLHRKENDKGYSPENCEWASLEVQANNTRTNNFVTAFGRTLTVTQWSRETGIPRYEITRKMKRGVSPENILQR